MRKALTITRNDLRTMRTNVMSALLVFALVVIPLAFTCFNVLASWDPFGNTDDLEVAVASTDEGRKSDLTALDINLGDQVLSQLSRNEDINWQIKSKEEALEGAKSGDYYAAIILPPSFSDDLLTFYLEDTDPVQLDLYTNEKINALSPMITSQGALGVINQIDTSFSEIVAGVGAGAIESLDEFLNEEDTQNSLEAVIGRLDDAGNRLDAGGQTARSLASLADSTIPLVESADRITQAAGESSGPGAPSDEQAVDLRETLQRSTESVSVALDATADSYAQVRQRLDETVAAGDAARGDSAEVLRSMAQQVASQSEGFSQARDGLETGLSPLLPPQAQPALNSTLAEVDSLIARSDRLQQNLTRAADDIESDRASSDDSQRAAREAVDSAIGAISTARAAYDNDLKPQIDALRGSVDTVIDDLGFVRQSIGDLRATISSDPGSAATTLGEVREGAFALGDRLSAQAQRLREASQAVQEARESGDFSQIAEVIGDDPEVFASQVASPVTVERTAVFPVTSFGAGMTPLYFTLALWIGALLACVLLKVNAEPDYLRRRPQAEGEKEPEFTRTSIFFGRFFTLLLVGLAQATLAALGLIFFIDLQPQHPFLLMCAAWASSAVFLLIIYTLVITLDNAGKALSVLLLVVQISGSSGAYPLPLLPEWFQNVSPWLPATHSVEAFRAAITGTYQGDFAREVGILLLFALPTLAVGIWLRPVVDGYLDKVKHAIEETKVMAT
ncbi:YhgE/Pip domain-containing protein [Corynebacterium yudongzhengii]|uniref:YhgE/Pip domain-containing protein n=1 Tax=Corynebacterium yudongzhengii TaxID=2080740 RepID=A0A2U1T4C2_9CORY|nr:YhgE/Pip domain-containing protein [Corynebacterium yudongzhengii]AWB81448.1 YhgE/Pip domain-containing protein [Corynebacterium yudongzhengii]PWC00833.1 YhgE/Pip domain-containing protein [Corynebacterium yudongzhengii]